MATGNGSRTGASKVRIIAHRDSGEHGIGVLVAMTALAVFSLLAIYMSLNATTELRIGDNFESEVEASFAARAGLNHAREAMRGLQHDDLLTGPDGTYTNTTAYLTQARTFGFRNPLSWDLARTVNVESPVVSGVADDGVMNTGKYGTTNGTAIVPLTGTSQTATNPYGSGTITTSRYFVKFSDNNGEASELAKDAANNPFVDGDGIIIARSMGIARTIRETAGGAVRANSVAIVEARFRMRSTFDLDAPLVVEGNRVVPSAPNMFDGNSFDIDGYATNPGIAVIDTQPADLIFPGDQISSQLTIPQRNNITGGGLGVPSIQDVTNSVATDADKQLLLDPAYLYNFAFNLVPQFADNRYVGNTRWSGSNAPDIGSYNVNLPPNDPAQHPKVTWVNGDLELSGNLSGGGLLVITGRMYGSGHFNFNGLILVIGDGDVNLAGMNLGINGGMLIVDVDRSVDPPIFGTPRLTIAGNSNIYINSAGLRMGMRLIPPEQVGWREIKSGLDP